MEQIEQLKAMRDSAKARLEAMPDYRLMNSLAALIDDLEDAFGLKPAPQPVASAEIAATKPATEAQAEQPVAEEIASPAQDTAAGEAPLAASDEMPANDFADAIENELAGESFVEIAETAETVEGMADGGETLVVETVETLELPQEAASASNAHAETNGHGEANGHAEANGHSNGVDASESEEDAVNRALDELSADLADATATTEPAPGVLNFTAN